MSLFGLDLGNRNSVVSIARRGGVDIALNDVSNRETPTVVSFGTGDGERLIGEKGLDGLSRQVKNSFPNLKRLLGVRWGSALHEHEKKYTHYQTREGRDGYIEVGGRIRGEMRWFTVEQLLAMFLSKMRRFAESEAKVGRVVDCVLTVPAYWTATQRRRYAAAAAVCDFHLLNLMNETSAAAVTYAVSRASTLPPDEASAERILIFDLGHSCTTITVVAMWRDAMRVVFHVCDPYVGVRDIIHGIVDHFAAAAKEKFKYDVFANPRDLVRFTIACEKAMKTLSANSEAQVSCELPEADLSFPMWKREAFEDLIQPQLARIRNLLQDAITAGGNIGSVEVIGGGSRIPSVKAMIRDVSGKEPQTTLNASESIAKGAGLNGAFLSPKFSLGGRSFNVWDASSHPLCVMYQSEKGNITIDELPHMNKRVQLLPMHEKLPKVLTLTFDRKESFDLAVVYDKSDIVAQVGGSRVLGQWRVDVPKIEARGKAPVKVVVRLGTNGVVSVDSATVDEEVEEEVDEEAADGAAAMAVDGEEKKEETDKQPKRVKRTNVVPHKCSVVQTATMEVPTSTVNEWRELERSLAVYDQQIEETAEARNALEAFCFNLRARIGDGGELRPYTTSADAAALEKAAVDLLDSLDCGELAEGTENLDAATYKKHLSAVEARVKPVQDRAAAFVAAREAESEVTRKINTTRNKLQDSKYVHLADADRDAVNAACDALGAWAARTFAELKSASTEADPPTTAAAIRVRTKQLDTDVNPIFAKAPAAPAAPAPAATQPGAEQGEKLVTHDECDGDGAAEPSSAPMEE